MLKCLVFSDVGKCVVCLNIAKKTRFRKSTPSHTTKPRSWSTRRSSHYIRSTLIPIDFDYCLFLLVLKVGNEGMIPVITSNNHPSNPHSLRKTHQYFAWRKEIAKDPVGYTRDGHLENQGMVTTRLKQGHFYQP